MFAIFLLAALGASIPQADVKEICRSATVDSLPEDRANAARGCIGDETSARDQLKREWGRFTAADRSNCAQTPGMKFSYVELLTCLEMQRGGSFDRAGDSGSPALPPPPPPMPAEASPKP
jgi:hypothetical protein